MKVHEIMTAHARCAGPENSLVEAAGLMRTLDVGSLPVCEGDRILGIITDRDIAIRAVADGRDPNATLVREVMSSSVASIMAHQDVEDAARLMQQREIRRLPVLSRNQRLVGILSLGDLAMSSTPAFSGITLREVSEPDTPNGRQRKRDALGRAAGAGEPIPRRDDQNRPEIHAANERPAASKAEAGSPTPRNRSRSSPKKRPATKKNSRAIKSDRARISSQPHELTYAGKKLGQGGTARVRKAKEALGRKTSRKTVLRKARAKQ